MIEKNNYPQGKQMAALLTVNLDCEQFWLGMFPDAARRPKTLSMGDYGITRGLDRVLKTYKDYEVRTTFFVPGKVAENHPQAIEKILNHNHEIALHGYSHTPFHLLTIEQQKEEIDLGIKAIKNATGNIPTGFRVPEGEVFTQTIELISQAGFLYSSSLYDEDRAYIHPNLGLIEIPMNWNTHDFPYFAFNYGPAFPSGQSRVAPYKRVEENYILEFDAYKHYGLTYMAQFTPQSIGSPGKIQILEHILNHVTQAESAWIGTCHELAHFIKHM